MIGRLRIGARMMLWLAAVVSGVSCGSVCGLGLRARMTASGSDVPCCGGFVFKDVPLTAQDSEFDLSSVAVAKPGLVDAFLVPASCTKLFDGPYPGAAPLCHVYTGPAAPGRVSSRVALPPGTYRLWLQGYTTNTSDGSYSVDIGIWNHSCNTPILQ